MSSRRCVQASRSWGDEHEGQPDAVVFEIAEGHVPQPGVFVVADVVLDAGAGAVTTLKDRYLAAGLVGEDRLEAVPVDIGEGQLRPGVRALAAHDHPRTLRPAGQVELLGDLGDLPVGALGLVLVDRCDPGGIGRSEDRGAHLVGQVKPTE